MIDLLAWYETNKQKLMAGGGIVIVVGFVGYFVNWKTTQTELNASNDLFRTRVEMSQSETETPDPSKLLTVASSHSGTAASGRAMLFAADAYFQNGQFEDAQKQFEAFMVAQGDSPLMGTAMFGVAACKDALGKTSEAMDAYRQVTTSFANSYLAFQAKLALAGLHESQGQATEAMAIYDELSHPTVPTTYSVEAGSRKDTLIKKHPELAPAETAEPAPEAGEATTE